MDARFVQGRLMRRGYTTGSSAAAAAKAATWQLLTQRPIQQVTITTLNNESLTLTVEEGCFTKTKARAAVRKDAGDDPDVTHNMLIVATVEKIDRGIEIEGGDGVGIVTKPGLDQPVGAAAINSGPRRSILNACQDVCRAHSYAGGLRIEIALPGGDQVAKRTFNPKLGIVGGLSILGTTGIVEPMSQDAIKDTIRAEIRVLAASHETKLLLCLGNYGTDFAKKMSLNLNRQVKCSNHIGDALSAAIESGFKDVLLLGHIGKMVKLGIGMLNTHSKCGDGRLETLMACALEAGAPTALLQKLLVATSTNAALDILLEASLLDRTLSLLAARIENTLTEYVGSALTIGFVVFRGFGVDQTVCLTSSIAKALMEDFRL